MVALSAASIGSIAGVPVPSYDRTSASVGIVHFGFGNFHRSHQAMYVDRLMESGSDPDWGICGVGLLPQDAAMRDVMVAQDCLYSLVLRHPDGSLEPRVVGSVLEYLFAPEQPEEVLAQLEDPGVRIVSLTVTEGGYLKDAATGAFDSTHPSVVHDVLSPQRPRTAFALIVEGLRRRRAAGTPPFTVLSCDNLQGNGDFARQAVTEFARLIDPEIAGWIEATVQFPNCMVDRITPATTDADRAAVREQFGIVDLWPVPAEPFTQWIVEDHFPAGRPGLEAVGVQFVPDVRPYELMKLRLLNASHQAIAYLGAPLGYVLVDEAMRDEAVVDFLLGYMRREAAPTLEGVEGIDVDAYIGTLIERFSNPMMADTLLRLATDGANRMATFTLPTIRANLEAGRPVALGALMVAAWAGMWEAIAAGAPPECGVPNDVSSEAMMAAAAGSAADPASFLGLRHLFGDLGDDPSFRAEYLRARSRLAAVGVAAAVEESLAAS